MKKLLLLFIIASVHCYSQQYGWTQLGSRLPDTPSTATISDVAVVGDSIWVTSGYGTYQNQVPGEIYFSTDKGNTFSIQTTKYGTHAICMLDSKRGWCGGVEGQIYKTTDGGVIWERKFSLSRTLMDIDFPPGSDTGMCTGFTGGVKMITPTGLVSVNMGGYVSNIYSVSCIDNEHAFVAGEEIIGPVYGGVLQVDQSYPGTNGIYAIDMLDTLRGWCVGSPTAAGSWDSSGCMIVRTVDGHNWVEQVNPVKGKTGTLMAVKALNENEVWAVGTSGVVLHTTDGGTNWVREAEGLSNEMLYGIFVVNSHDVWVTGNKKTLLHYGPLNDVKEDGMIRSNLTVSPNPATEYIEIAKPSECLEPSEGCNVRIYNALGECVMDIVMNDETQGLASLQRVDISRLPVGAYYLRMSNMTCKFIIAR